ncbi:hypothetical protein [Methylomonas sp. AM2-LC]|uniref:hypothetical protein n=1 Tax=Methylomonas sp. AM2-LC TaxID=3153301 RepID=UPI0032676B9C
MQTDLAQPDTFQGSMSWKADTMMGLQAGAYLTDQIDATVQFVIKDRVNQTLNENLAWAFLRWKPNQDVTLRTGRLGFDIYMLSDYRNVSFAYLWERPPVEFYGPLLFQNFDGIDGSWKTHIADGFLTAKVFAGTTTKSIPPPFANSGPSLLCLGPITGGKLTFETESLRLSSGFAYMSFDKNFAITSSLSSALSDPNLQTAWNNANLYADQVNQLGKSITFFALGASYDANDWVVQSELGYLHSNWAGFRDLPSGYFSLGRHFANLTPYVLFSMARSAGSASHVVPPEIQGDAINQLYTNTQLFMRGSPVNQKTVSLGVRWDVLANMAVKVQWDYTQIASNADSLWINANNLSSVPATNVNLLSASINWAF